VNSKAFCNLGSFVECSKFGLKSGANAKHEKPLRGILQRKWKIEQNLAWACVILSNHLFNFVMCNVIPILLVVLYERNECHLT
jgi:hypothetical protein